MQAIEFETMIANNYIKIPLKFKNLNNKKAKVSLHIEENNREGNYDKESLIEAFEKAGETNIFKNIDNSVLWQQDRRNEWE
jgi:hypothetical protein